VILVEAGDRVLSMFTEDLSARALRDLRDLGVDVRVHERVVDIDADGVQVGETRIPARTVIWAAGVQPSGLNQRLGTELDRAGRAIVQPDLSLKEAPHVFVLGDQAHAEQDGKPLPGLAPVALQQGKAAAENILRDLAGQPRKPFRYFDKGQMATIGKSRAVAETGKTKFTGWLAWLAWLFIHVMYLINFRNRLAVMSNWVWSYVFGKRNARLIVLKTWRSYGDHGEV
jgi:NADH dehydrogenase